jgi:hypothetical protein
MEGPGVWLQQLMLSGVRAWAINENGRGREATER